MARWIYGCSTCQYRSTRKSNAVRHISDVHQGTAELLLFSAPQMWLPRWNYSNNYNDISLPLRTPVAAASLLNAGSKNKTEDDFLTYAVDRSKKLVEFHENLKKLSGNNINLALPQFTDGNQYASATLTPLIASIKNLQTKMLYTAAAHTSSSCTSFSTPPNDHDMLGIKCYICEKCFSPEFVPFSLTSDPKSRGGLPGHLCQRAQPLIQDADMHRKTLETVYQDLADAMADNFNEWWQCRNHLIALEVNSLPSFPLELNLIKFGSLDRSNINNNYLFRAINEEAIAVTNAELHDFVRRTHATYALFEFDYNNDGINKFYYFMYMSGVGRNTAPKK